MKNFKDYSASIIEAEIKKENSKTFEKSGAEAIKLINSIIEFGRNSTNLDNKQLNPLLDAIKNIHSGQDAIRKSSAEPENIPKEKKKNEEPQW